MQELDLSVSALLDDLADRLGPLFPGSETRDRALRYLQGLLSQCERKNSWHLAEWLGDATPDGVQYLLDRARWGADAARDILRQWVIDCNDPLVSAHPTQLMLGVPGVPHNRETDVAALRCSIGSSGRSLPWLGPATRSDGARCTLPLRNGRSARRARSAQGYTAS